jgi:glucose-6-phosphate 1-dehydrogenase
VSYLIGKQLDPTVVVIFGASGDLTWRKLVPALYGLFGDRCLPRQFAVVGVLRRPQFEGAWRSGLRERLQQISERELFQESWSSFERQLTLFVGILGDTTLFMRADQVDAAWSVMMPMLKAWESIRPIDFPNYAAGTWGPEAAQALIAQHGGWLQPALAAEAEEGEPVPRLSAVHEESRP